MVRRSLLGFVMFMFAMGVAQAGKIYGTLQFNGQAVAQGTAVILKCSGQRYSALVGKHGRYTLNVRGEGPCSLTVGGYAGASARVVSYGEPTRYNFIISKNGNGYIIGRM
ncbi:MAG: hypothetical protein GXP10_05425 [Gammaproteobacteria bacterium]|nr:hypothetical protein [Gammaproteobacteria bacterium]